MESCHARPNVQLALLNLIQLDRLVRAGLCLWCLWWLLQTYAFSKTMIT
jgi:hypothetical protein